MVASLEKLSLPPVHPSTVGVKVTLTSKLCAAGKTRGRFNWDIAYGPLATAPETVTLVCPSFVTVTSRVSLCPRATTPNARCAGEHAICGVAAPARTPPALTKKIAIAIAGRKWDARTDRDRRMDWGSRIPSSLSASL
jgi:hypothetical protein